MASFHPNSITKETFDPILSRYSTTAPEKLHNLDHQRYEEIPARVAKRKQGGDVFLTKDEAITLVEWKLKHGTFRPKLLSLVQSNPDSEIESSTRKAFSVFSSDTPSHSTSSTCPPGVKASIQILTGLHGIGPATASLFVSVFSPGNIPFFSDELFRWVMWDVQPGSGTGWKRVIKYTKGEYEGFVVRAGAVVQRLGVRADELERVAWVLGREGVDVLAEAEAEGNDGKNGELVKKSKKEVEEPTKGEKEVKEPAKKGVKRKATETKPLVQELRRSTRKK